MGAKITLEREGPPNTTVCENYGDHVEISLVTPEGAVAPTDKDSIIIKDNGSKGASLAHGDLHLNMNPQTRFRENLGKAMVLTVANKEDGILFNGKPPEPMKPGTRKKQKKSEGPSLPPFVA